MCYSNVTSASGVTDSLIAAVGPLIHAAPAVTWVLNVILCVCAN